MCALDPEKIYQNNAVDRHTLTLLPTICLVCGRLTLTYARRDSNNYIDIHDKSTGHPVQSNTGKTKQKKNWSRPEITIKHKNDVCQRGDFSFFMRLSRCPPLAPMNDTIESVFCLVSVCEEVAGALLLGKYELSVDGSLLRSNHSQIISFV